jgi:hypothetical protein
MMPKPHDAAETCCKKGACEDCGKETGSVFIHKCFDCREKSALCKAEKVENWSGPVVYNDHYYENMDDLLECNDEALPEFVWVAETEHFPKIDIENFLQEYCENLFEEAEEHLEGVKDLAEAFKAFNEANEKNTYWMESGKRAARVYPLEEDASNPSGPTLVQDIEKPNKNR